MKFCELTEVEFEDFRATYPEQSFFQSNEMLAFERIKGYQVVRVGIKESDQVIAAAGIMLLPVFRSYTFARILRGPMIAYDNAKQLTFFFKELQGFLKQKRCLYAHMDPYITYKKYDCDGNFIEAYYDEQLFKNLQLLGWQHQGFTTKLDDFEPRWICTLDLLGATEKTLLKAMKSNTKRSIQAAMKHHVKVEEVAMDDVSKMVKLIEATADRRDFYRPDVTYFQNMMTCFKEKAKALYVYLEVPQCVAHYEERIVQIQKELEKALQASLAKPEVQKYKNLITQYQKEQESVKESIEELLQLKETHGDIVALAAGFFVIDKQEIVYLWGGSDTQFKKWKGPSAMQWYMLQYGLQHEIPRYNFYGISGNLTSSAEDYGVYQFKRGFNVAIEELPGNFISILNPRVYKMYQMLRKLKAIIKRT